MSIFRIDELLYFLECLRAATLEALVHGRVSEWEHDCGVTTVTGDVELHVVLVDLVVLWFAHELVLSI